MYLSLPRRFGFQCQQQLPAPKDVPISKIVSGCIVVTRNNNSVVLRNGFSNPEIFLVDLKTLETRNQ
jgi:hypothetical protein